MFFLLFNIFSNVIFAYPGVAHGHFAIQIAQNECLTEIGIHVSKSKNQFSTPKAKAA